jgi:hypothetical protein
MATDLPSLLGWLRANFQNPSPAVREQLPRVLDQLASAFQEQETERNTLLAQITKLRTAGPAGGVVGGVGTVGTTVGGIGGTGTGAAAGAVSPLDIAKSFKSVMDTIQAESRQAPGISTTMKSLDIELKGLVQVQANQTAIVFPTGAIDPSTAAALSTMKASFTAVPVVGTQAPAPAPPPDGRGPGPPRPPAQRDTVDQKNERVRRYLDSIDDENHWVHPHRWRSGVEQFKNMKVVDRVPLARPRLAAPAPAPVAPLQWTQIGPAPLSIEAEQNYMGVTPCAGQATDVAIDPSGATDQVIYVATNDGGIWKSSDGGTTWTPKTDSLLSISMGAVILDPANPSTIYAGTGNVFNNWFFKAIGIYKSTDGGDSWTLLNPQNIFTTLVTSFMNPNDKIPRGIIRMVMPATNILLVATTAGLFRSIDGGQNFGKNATADDGQPVLDGFISDVVVDTASASTAYAGVAGSGLFKSTDSGATFPTNLFSNPGFDLTQHFGNISIGQGSPPKAGVLFASISGDTGLYSNTYFGLFKSTDGGSTWLQGPAFTSNAGAVASNQVGYDHVIGVDPQNADRVYLGFKEVFLSTDGGKTFGTPALSASKAHFDQHALVFSPSSHWGAPAANPTPFYECTDGGLSFNPDGGASNWKNLNDGVATNLFLGIDIGRGNPNNNGYTYGGCQDTGTVEHRANDGASTTWHLGIDGDGSGVAVDPTNPANAYGNDDLWFLRTTDAGANWTWGAPYGTWVVALDPNDPTRVFIGSRAGNDGQGNVSPGRQLLLSTDSGTTFNQVGGAFPDDIRSLSMVAKNSDVMWAGLADGTLQKTTNAKSGTAAAWAAPAAMPPAPPSHPAAGIAIDPTNTDQVVVVYQGAATGPVGPPVTRTQRVYRTTDGGATWNDIGGTDNGDPAQNVPDIPLNAVAIDPSTLPHTIYVASIAGVLRTADEGATWQVVGTNFPTVDCTSIVLDPTANGTLIRVGTFGRSVWELIVPSAGAALNITAINPNQGPVAGGTQVTINGSGFTGFTGVGFGGTNAPTANLVSDSQITATSPPGNAAGDVQVTVVTPAGTSNAVTFTYQPPGAGPNIIGITPMQGPVGGGTQVTINGSGFTGFTGVGFGGTNAPSANLVSDSQITATSPPGNAAGDVQVTVVTPAGTSNPVTFTYVTAPPPGPTITSISPTQGALAGGDTVTINGSGFTGFTGVGFGGTNAPNANLVSDSQITATTPPGNAAGDVQVTVVTPAGTSNAVTFTYVAAPPPGPTISSISPTQGALAGGDTVTINGSGFTGFTGVGFGGTNAPTANLVSDSQITATSPPGNAAGDVQVTVVTPAGTSNPMTFTYQAAGPTVPTITSISPTQGALAGGDTVTINGSGFTGFTGVGFGGTNAPNANLVSDSQITATTPAGNAAGDVQVTVVTPAGTSNPVTFTYQTGAPSAPTISSISPTQGALAGGDTVTINGSGFTGFTGMGFGGTNAPSANLVSDSQITATSPPGNAAGDVQVTVVTAVGTSNAVTFTYQPPGPGSVTISRGGMTVTILFPDEES